MSKTTETENLTPQSTETEGAPTSLIEGTTETETTETEAEVEAPAPLTAEDLVFPEGVEIVEALRDKFLEAMNNSELSPKDRAAALINLQAEAITAASEASSAAWNTMQDQWRAEVHTQLGDKFQPTIDSVNRLVTEYGSPELLDVLGLTGAGNNVHVIKFLGAVAEKLTEGTFASGAPTGQATSAAQRMFPSMKG